MLSPSILSAIIDIASKHSSSVSEIVSANEVGGGCINIAYSVKTNAGGFFVKVNSASRYPGMFEAEAQGLNLLAGASPLAVPEVVGVGEAGGSSFLVLELIEGSRQRSDFWENFGRGLAQLHMVKSNLFGLDRNNYIGSLEQANEFKKSWIEFFVLQRLEPQIKLAKQKGIMPAKTENDFNKLFNRLADIFPEEHPSLLHGDLWGGNYMTGSDGKAVIIDPAVYFGHRYMDLGMTKLFGGFPESFYRFYNQEFPLENNWQQGIDVANLYPLLVHVNLFGTSYLSGVTNILKRFC